MQLLLRFLLGGFFVSLFAVLGDSFKPKSFAGLFGAAPSVALAGFVLGWPKLGATTAAIEARSMIFGSAALIAYCMTCALLVRRTKLAPWLAAGLLWVEWLAAAFALYFTVLR